MGPRCVKKIRKIYSRFVKILKVEKTHFKVGWSTQRIFSLTLTTHPGIMCDLVHFCLQLLVQPPIWRSKKFSMMDFRSTFAIPMINLSAQRSGTETRLKTSWKILTLVSWVQFLFKLYGKHINDVNLIGKPFINDKLSSTKWNILLSLLVYFVFNYSQTLGTPNKRPLFPGGRYSKGASKKLELILDLWGSIRSLLTGGFCSEVVISTDLTVPYLFAFKLKLVTKVFR
jgi:hypothetical protein